MVKNPNFWPIVKDATGLKLLFILFLATLGQNSVEYMTNSAKIVNLLWKSSRNTTMGRFLKKCHTEYFLIYHFGKPLRCLTTSTPGFTRPTKFGKLDRKKGCDMSSLSKKSKKFEYWSTRQKQCIPQNDNKVENSFLDTLILNPIDILWHALFLPCTAD